MVQDSCCGKMFRELFPQTKEMTLPTFLEQWCKGMFLSLKTDGTIRESVSPRTETESWNGVCLTLNTSEYRNAAEESSLYSILEHGGGRPPILFESESLPRNFEKSGRKRQNPSENSEGDFGEDGFDVERGGYDKVGAICADDHKGINNQYVGQGKVVIEKKDTMAFTCEPQMAISKNIIPTIRQRDYKDPNCVLYAETKTYDMKGHHNPQESDTVSLTTKNCSYIRGDSPLVVDDVVSWNERDRLSNPKLNVTDPIVSTAYKGSNLVGYFGDCDVFSIEGNGQRPSHRGAGINDNGVQYTLNTTEVHAVAYKEEDE